MTEKNDFSYYHPITVRYGDLDPQEHVNNAVYLTYLESARLGYYQKVGIWEGGKTVRTGMVVAHIDIDYISPIFLGQAIQIGLRLKNLGNKSFTLAFQITDSSENKPLARGTSVMVAYDDAEQKSVPLPKTWREKLLNDEEKRGS